jgi:hypothetical protein
MAAGMAEETAEEKESEWVTALDQVVGSAAEWVEGLEPDSVRVLDPAEG